jgi:hypothetical protein
MFTKTTKTLVAALMLAGISLAFVGNASAAPRQGWSPVQENSLDRAAYGGHAPGDTNGF